MRDAFGGIVNLTFLVVFMVIVNGYLAFAANYNKAYKYKNKIINIIEQNEGYDDNAKTKIHKYRVAIGYSLDTDIKVDGITGCSEDACCVPDEGFCYKENTQTTGELDKKYYTVTTAVNIDIPILNKFLPNMNVFQVSGDTKTITKH